MDFYQRPPISQEEQTTVSTSVSTSQERTPAEEKKYVSCATRYRNVASKALEALNSNDITLARELISDIVKKRYSSREVFDWMVANNKTVEEALEAFPIKESRLKAYIAKQPPDENTSTGTEG